MDPGEGERTGQAPVGLCWPLSQVPWSSPAISHLIHSCGGAKRGVCVSEGQGKEINPELAKANEKPQITSEV